MTTPPDGDASRFALPRTTYLWLALLLLVTALSALQPRPPSRDAGRGSERLTSAAFEKYVNAESKVRAAFGISFAERISGPAAGAQAANREKALADAVRDYRDLLDETHAPNIPRRILILENALGRPLNPALITVDLEAALKAAKASPAERQAEQTLWRDLYGRRRVVPAKTAEYEGRIRAMRLRSLENWALHDLYAAAGDTPGAERFARRQEERSEAFLLRMLALGVPLILGFVAGLVFLILFLVSARHGQWQRVMRVATREQRLSWGALLDAFVFYLFLVRGLGFLGSTLIRRFDWTPTPTQEVMLSAALQIGTGLAALTYLQVKARARGATLADIGLSARSAFWANVGYGVAGYAAILPILLVLRGLAQIVFRHVPNTSPNPIMPLIVADRDLGGRLLIFVMVAVAAPFFEELFFRGALFSGLRTRWGWVACALLSGAVFALAHPPQDWLPIFGLGFGLATMREMRQSLVPGMVAHLLQNSLAFLYLSLLFNP